ncbi:MAG: VWA domain-containing protein [Ruminobacter sp.]|nr:VWA domain-containing protein [Ruminobacter sp.]
MGVLSFGWPLCFLLLVVPFIIRYLPGKSKKDDFIFITSLPHFLQKEPKNKVYLLFSLAYASWFFLVLALARPIYLADVIVISQPHRDIYMAIDLSDSMEIQDMFDDKGKAVTRLSVVKKEVKEFIKSRDNSYHNDRIGLILFADNAYVLSPLTFDKKLLLNLVDELDFSLAGQFTNIGAAINLTLERFEEAGTNQKILILLSDGKNTVEGVDPITVATTAQDNNMKIYTIGFGGGVQLDQRGKLISEGSTDLDEETLKRVAEITKGHYYRVDNSRSLHSKYQEISYLEAEVSDAISYQPEIELYQWPLILALIFAIIAGIAVRRING